jgi:hypothetical protein
MTTQNFNILCLILHLSYLMAYELVYHTQNCNSLQYYDCIYYTLNRIKTIEESSVELEIKHNILGVKYCRQLFNTTSLQRHLFTLNSTCYHDGVLVRFSQLQSKNVSAIDVLKFSSSVERADKYAVYLQNVTDHDDDFLCNCTRPGTFGKFCEYQFNYNSLSFDEAITKQFQAGYASLDGSQFHNNRPYYTTLVCDSGLMCLDWRNICDGRC